MRQVLRQGRQVYVVYPLIEESEKTDLRAATAMAEQLQREVLPEFRVGLLHGRLKSDEKEHIMRAFQPETSGVGLDHRHRGWGGCPECHPHARGTRRTFWIGPITPAPGARGAQPSPSVLSVDGRFPHV